MYREEIIKELKKLKINEKNIAIQIPEGLKQYSDEIIDTFKNKKIMLFLDPCYGACDLKDKEAIENKADILIHIGHYKMGNPKIKTKFIPLNYKLENKDIEFIIKKIKENNLKKINLITTIQYLKNIEIIKKLLKKENIEVIKAKETNRVKKHMVLGCDSSTITKNKHPIVFIGDGVFHINNIAFINKENEIYTISPITNEFKEIKLNQLFIKKRYAQIAQAQKCNKFGILVSTKHGQNRIELAYKLKKFLEKKNKKAYIFISDYIKPEYVSGINVDCFINTACPRITYDDYNQYKKPLLSPTEIEVVFDLNKELKIDQIK